MRGRTASLMALGALAGCADIVDLPEQPAPIVLVEGVLVAGADAATLRVTRPEGSGEVPSGTAAAAFLVDLRLVPPGAAPAPFGPVADSAGYFRARLAIVAGGRYRLEGTVAGTRVGAETTVPGALELAEPRADTVEVGLGQNRRLTVRWRAAGASLLTTDGGFFVLNPPGSGIGTQTRDSVVGLLVPPPDRPADVPLVVWALNPDAERYLFADAPRGNVRGGFGLLGGAATARRILRWR